jgi:hypothetical protein
MFYELMMRKKTEIMYATIKGSLTENDGVFSGFSASNYLQLQDDIDTSKDWEVVAKFDNTTSKYHSVILGGNSTAYTLKIEVSYGTRFFIFLSSNGTSWNIANGAYGLTNAMSLGNTYYMKLTYSTVSGYKLYLSTDGKEWVSQYNNGATNPLYMTGSKFALGVSLFDNNSLGGGIDLNRSYIKSQSTKYNLQAVVGYTIVGSPTISDGVVSGFSATSYLTVPKPTTINKFELNIKFSFTSLSNYQFFFGDNTNNGIQLQKNNNTSNTIRLRYCNGSSSTNISIFENPTINKDYIINVKVKGTKAFVIFEIVGEEKFTQEYNLDYNVVFKTSNWLLGKRNINEGTSGILIGAIYLNETYIKINDKLWFNGQQA